MLLFIILLGIISIVLSVIIIVWRIRLPHQLAAAMVRQYYDDEIIEMYPCMLFVEIKPDEYDGIDWDFSKYEDKGIIAMIVHTIDSVDDVYDIAATAEAKVRTELGIPDDEVFDFPWDVGIIPEAYVYKTLGGKIRCYIE